MSTGIVRMGGSVTGLAGGSGDAPVFVLTGGDPLKRPDIFELVEYASTHRRRFEEKLNSSDLSLHEQGPVAKARRRRSVQIAHGD